MLLRLIFDADAGLHRVVPLSGPLAVALNDMPDIDTAGGETYADVEFDGDAFPDFTQVEWKPGQAGAWAPIAPRRRKLTLRQFRRRFTPAERAKWRLVLNGRAADLESTTPAALPPKLQAYAQDLDDFLHEDRTVDPESDDTLAGLQLLVQLGVIAADVVDARRRPVTDDDLET